MTDGPWQIPESWAWAKMGEIADVVGGGTPRTTEPSYWKDGAIAWLTPADLSGYTEKTIQHGARDITELGLQESSARLMPPGTVLYTSRAPIGYVAIASGPVATNQGFKSFILKGELLPDYFYYYLKRAKGLVLNLASGTTFSEISGTSAARIPASVAPFGEQRRIVEAIETQFTRLDAAEETLKRVQANLKRYRASVLQAAVEGRLVPTGAELARREGRNYEHASVLLEYILQERRRRWEEAELARMRAKGREPKGDAWRAKYKEPGEVDTSGLPELPEGWCWARLGQLCEVATGATPKRGETRYYEGGAIPWITSGAVNDGKIFEAKEFVTKAALRETNIKQFPSGTILVAMYGEGKTRGMSAELMIEATTNQAVAALVFRGNTEHQGWVKLFLDHNYESTRRLASGGVQPNLNLGIVRSLRIPLPPLAEQIRILDTVSRLHSATAAAERDVAEARARVAGLRQNVLRWAFEGKLVDQDPEEEPASTLLDRIREYRARPTRGVVQAPSVEGASA